MWYIQSQRGQRRCWGRLRYSCLLHLSQRGHFHQHNYTDATKQRKTPSHAFTSEPADAASPAVSRYCQPSRSSIVRVPYAAFASECVTCTIVVPCSFNVRNSCIISFACSECRFPVGSSANKRSGL